MTGPDYEGVPHLPSVDERANRYENMSIAEIIGEALVRLDAVTLSPEQAREILRYHQAMMAELIEEGVLEPDEFVSDKAFTLSEIAHGTESQSFGKVYRKYHVSSEGQPFMGGVRESALATDLEGAIWPAIWTWKHSSTYPGDEE